MRTSSGRHIGWLGSKRCPAGSRKDATGPTSGNASQVQGNWETGCSKIAVVPLLVIEQRRSLKNGKPMMVSRPEVADRERQRDKRCLYHSFGVRKASCLVWT